MDNAKPEVWLRGPLAEVPDLLQPAAHALIQSREEIRTYLKNFSEELLWEKPMGRASVGFHLQHLTGVIDRMLTYAKERPLSVRQFDFLKKEGKSHPEISSEKLVTDFCKKVDEALEVIKQTPQETLTDFRPVGRKRLPSTVIGLLFHAGEHSQRHVGQLLVTLSILNAYEES